MVCLSNTSPWLPLCSMATLVILASSVGAREISRTVATQAESTEQLLSVQLIFRHGDRTPYWIYKNDPYQLKEYPEGEGQLINRGKERMYRYGQYLRQRYAQYIKNISLRNIIAESSPIRRCVETSLAVLAGFFPPSRDWSNQSISKLWQPIAVQTVEESRSWKLNPDAPCRAAEQIERDMTTSNPELKRFLEENKNFTKVVGNYTGEDYFHHWSWLYMGYLYDTLFTEQMYFGASFVQPDWIDKVGNDTWQRLSQFNDMVFTIYGQAPKFLKLRAGTFFKALVDNFAAAVKSQPVTDSNRMLYSYGSHDTMEAYILHVLGLYKNQPTYGSGLIFELRQLVQESEPTVHLFYSNLTDNANVNATNQFDIYQLNLNESARFIHRCKQSYCQLSLFTDSLSDYLEDNPQRDCLN